MIRLQVCLDPKEVDLLDRWAQMEMRDLRGHIRFLLRQELERRGFLTSNMQINSISEVIDVDNQYGNR